MTEAGISFKAGRQKHELAKGRAQLKLNFYGSRILKVSKKNTSMRIVTWNVNNGDLVAKLFRTVEYFHPDIAVLTEASKPTIKLPNVHWMKDSETRGIAVYASPGYSISPITEKPLHTCVHGYRVSGPRSFILLACWSHAGKHKDDYRECWVAGIEAYGKYLKGKDVVIAGDFNDNAFWDNEYRAHYKPIQGIFEGYRLKHNVVSAYHEFYKTEMYGKESRPSLFLQKSIAKPYHVDYVLVPQSWTPIGKVSLGKHADWLSLSDHMPLLVQIDDP